MANVGRAPEAAVGLLKNSESSSTPNNNTSKMKSSSDKSKDIWMKIVEHNKAMARATGGDRPDSHLFVVGSPQGGKSTLISRFLNPEKEEAVRPTRGLEYTYARRQARGVAPAGAGALDPRKEVAHVWEISGKRELSEAIASREGVFLSLMMLATSVVLIVVDLSKPHEVLDTLLFWLRKVRERAESCYQRLLKRGSKLPEQMMARSRRQFGLSHEDRDQVRLIGIPLVIAATKHDVFKSQEAEPCKIMARVLRYFAHLSGAHLVYLGGLGVGKDKERPGTIGPDRGVLQDHASRARSRSQEKAAVDHFRSLLNHLLFFIPLPKVVEFDHNRLLCVPVGSDKFRDISRPKANDNNVNYNPWESGVGLGGDRQRSVLSAITTTTAAAVAAAAAAGGGGGGGGVGQKQEREAGGIFPFQSTSSSAVGGISPGPTDDDREVVQWMNLVQNTFPTPNPEPQRPWSLDSDKYKEPEIDAIKAKREAELAEGKRMQYKANTESNLFHFPPPSRGATSEQSVSV
ncbi:hypothetical protein CBR_g40327 [Chara braunii]|uniref:Cytoplasmic dynein 2 light intermediate chain 1 n=1 Tax=Chara braunii TaxID=69332 RepID=A0A388LTL8_CHABU|nr:hypothetical protein CBR_g40327 [Chara braunii]|eukprot:GBG85599.1 hypothetical protein CBR_g40327 [Chara braunii]